MFTAAVTIVNTYGIHCRPSAEICKVAQGYKGKITVTNPDGVAASPSSVLSLLTLGLACGDEVTITVEGPDEQVMGDKMVEMFSRHFDFTR